MEYVNLNRYFVPVGKDEEPHLDLGTIMGPKYGGWISWEELRRHRRVVLLAEASSGKTREFEQQAAALVRDGHPAFFATVEQVADLGLAATFGPEDTERLAAWRQAGGAGTLFLDSRDEAQLTHKSFDLALKRVATELGPLLSEANVLVSCRVSDWGGTQDRRSIEMVLPVPPRPPMSEPAADPDAALLDPIFAGKKKEVFPRELEPEKPAAIEVILVVQLVPLTRDQRGQLAAAAAVADPEAFLRAIDRHGLEPLAERPGDLLELAAYWNDYGKFGSLAEMTEHAVSRKLGEANRYRPDAAVLSRSRAGAGAERIAAALTLGKSLTLRAPGQEFDPRLAAGALDPDRILDDWTDAERTTLLRRGIFAPSTFGRVRFHHRSTQEYLAAAWLERLLAEGCALREIFHLLFADPFGVATVVPSLRAAAAWLALRNDAVRDEIIRREPMMLLQEGDPGSLPVPVRKTLLLTLAARHIAGEVANDRVDHRALWMFADPELTDAIREAWTINTRPDFRGDLLRMMREGEIRGCGDLVIGFAADPAQNDHYRLVAIEVLVRTADTAGCNAVAAMARSTPEAFSSVLAAGMARLLFPAFLSVADLLTLIARAEAPRRDSGDGFERSIEDLVAAAADAAARHELLDGLARLSRQQPHVRHRRLSQRFEELPKALVLVLRREVTTLGDQPPPPWLLRLIMAVERADLETSDLHGPDSIPSLFAARPQLQRALFWADLQDARRRRKSEAEQPICHWQVTSLFAPFWHFGAADTGWLLDDFARRKTLADRRILLSALASVYAQAETLKQERTRLRALVKGDPTLTEDLKGYLKPRKDPHAVYVRRQEVRRVKEEAQTEVNKVSWKDFRARLQADTACLSDPAIILKGQGWLQLWHVLRWLRARTGKDEAGAAAEWPLLASVFGQPVAEAFRDGMRRLWRGTEPERPTRGEGNGVQTKYVTILSFAGLAVDAREAGWASQLSPDEAARAAQHGCLSEQGYPEWIDSLLAAHPDTVRPIVAAELREEWLRPMGAGQTFLYHLAQLPALPTPALVDDTIQLLRESDPPSANALERALELLAKATLTPEQAQRIDEIARQRLWRPVKAGQEDRTPYYLAALFMLDARAGILALCDGLAALPSATRDARSLATIAALFHHHRPLVPVAFDKVPVGDLVRLVRTAYASIRPGDDRVRESGGYTPDLRDNAEHARGTILSALLGRPEPEAYLAVRAMGDDPALVDRSLRYRELARGMAERASDATVRTVADVLALERRRITLVRSAADLFRLTLSVLDDIQFDLDHGDASPRKALAAATDENAVQNLLAHELRLRAHGRYHVHREAQIALDDMPDILISAVGAPYEVAIEVKHGGKDWSARVLDEALRTQLAEDYLKPATRRHGIFVLSSHGPRTWKNPETGQIMEFRDLLIWLGDNAAGITTNASGPIKLLVRGLDAAAEKDERRGRSSKRAPLACERCQ